MQCECSLSSWSLASASQWKSPHWLVLLLCCFLVALMIKAIISSHFSWGRCFINYSADVVLYQQRHGKGQNYRLNENNKECKKMWSIQQSCVCVLTWLWCCAAGWRWSSHHPFVVSSKRRLIFYCKSLDPANLMILLSMFIFEYLGYRKESYTIAIKS